MDNLKTLMNDRNFDLVVKLTESSKDATSLFYRISAFMGLNKPQECLKIIDANKKVLSNDNLYLLMKMHIEILCITGNFDEAYYQVRKYEEYPYVSQVVEEYLKELPNIIRNEEKQFYQNKQVQIDDISKMLTSKNKEEILYAFSILKRSKETPCLSLVEKLLTSCPYQDIRSLALLLLMEKKVDKMITFLSKDKTIEVNPSKIRSIECDDYYIEVTNEINKLTNKSPSLKEIINQNLTLYFLYNLTNENLEFSPILLALGLTKLSLDCFGQLNVADENLLSQFEKVNEQQLDAVVNSIKKDIEFDENK